MRESPPCKEEAQTYPQVSPSFALCE